MHPTINRTRLRVFRAFAYVILIALGAHYATAEPVKVMLLTGRSNKFHSWQGTSAAIEHHLENAGIFAIEKVVAPPAGSDMNRFLPKWSDYQVVVLDYDGEEWPDLAKRSFVEYVRGGGGLVLVHSSNNAFPYWPEFLELTGLGGWGGRNEKWGPRVYWRDGETVRDHSPGAATHPPRHDFIITVRDHEHPITRGLPEMWLHTDDELYTNLRGPANNITVLATGFANPNHRKASPYNEPVLFTVDYGKGRVFQTVLGHVGAKADENVTAVSNVGFIVTLQRAVEWAATGEVTQAVPDDFPTVYAPGVRPGPTAHGKK